METARTAFILAHELGWESQFSLALMHLAEGDAGTAARQFCTRSSSMHGPFDSSKSSLIFREPSDCPGETWAVF